MKKLIPFIILTLGLFLLHSCVKANDSIGHDGRCTGSAYCTACTNCSRCGHCGSGGTCGVCSGNSSGRSSSSETHKKSKPKKHKTSNSYTSSKGASKKAPKVELNVNVNSNNRYIAGINGTKIYEKPSFKSNIVTTVSKNAKLIQLSKKGSWIKVKVKSNGKIGYVDSKYVK
ncbi:SH3 domain-containing protein [Chryseobacterium shandongense]|uniref:SH3 domain-containing protein n=1 Tax=Chryseobacterium shandongense TaxID=1493872 RepID=A0A3G6R2X3_9FLAO|nr:SH3 domain-containing protein [Chryseobacterium shandongense]AZA55798.1 SH3 domain-containing protein [Chryseobacterium shandongense]AZA87727.1 SH3 domain-containing protein [Chryseobacterium shandongense]AZA96225.1 SH3 domain-containing protein [Chryseobacterium shandongense]